MLDLVKGRLEELGWRIVAAPSSPPFTGAARQAGREIPSRYPGPADATSSCACRGMVGSMADDLELGKSLIVRLTKRVAELEKKVDDMQLESCQSRNADGEVRSGSDSCQEVACEGAGLRAGAPQELSRGRMGNRWT